MRRTCLCLAVVMFPAFAFLGGVLRGRPATSEDLGGISLGSPRSMKDGSVSIPIQFVNPYWERHAASLPPYLRRITAEVDGTRVYLRVELVSGLARRDLAPRELTFRPRQSGPHEILYRDPDGTLHRVATVPLQTRPAGSGGSSFRRRSS